MNKKSYKLWLDYHKNKYNKNYTSNELKEIGIIDFSMSLLVPTEHFFDFIGGSEKLELINGDDIYNLSKKFNVPEEVIIIRTKELLEEKKHNHLNEVYLNRLGMTYDEFKSLNVEQRDKVLEEYRNRSRMNKTIIKINSDFTSRYLLSNDMFVRVGEEIEPSKVEYKKVFKNEPNSFVKRLINGNKMRSR